MSEESNYELSKYIKKVIKDEYIKEAFFHHNHTSGDIELNIVFIGHPCSICSNISDCEFRYEKKSRDACINLDYDRLSKLYNKMNKDRDSAYSTKIPVEDRCAFWE